MNNSGTFLNNTESDDFTLLREYKDQSCRHECAGIARVKMPVKIAETVAFSRFAEYVRLIG